MTTEPECDCARINELKEDPPCCSHSVDGYTCTQLPGHEGDHIACGTENHLIAREPNLGPKIDESRFYPQGAGEW